jgi:spermidine synthase
MLRPRPILISPLFFLSGMAGLGCQMVWSRQFGMGLGTEMASVLAIICGFLGGMALGAWRLDEKIGRSPRPGRWYAALELTIGCWAILTTFFLPPLQDLALRWIGLEPSFLRHWSVAFIVPFLALLPATAAMGATLPAIDRWLAPSFGERRAIGFLYAINTAGAVFGTLGAAFFIIPALGFRTSLLSFACLNLLCGAFASLFQGGSASQEIPNQNQFMPVKQLITLGVAGMLGIGYEVVGIRLLSQVLENTVYTFAAVLAVYLLGTALGAAFYHFLGRKRAFQPFLDHLLISLSTACLLGAVFLAHSQAAYDGLRSRFGDSPGGVFTAEMAVALLVFGLATLCMGALFSLLVQNSRRAHAGVGRAAAANILGGALAPVFFGVLLLPAIGAKWTLIVIGLGYLGLLNNRGKAAAWLAMPGAAAAFVLVANFQLVQTPPETKVAAYREGVAASVAVLEDSATNRTLRVNNRFQMGGTAAAAAEYRHAHIPLLLHPKPRHALFLGLGTGISLGGATFHPDLFSDGVELLPEVIEVMPRFEPFNFSPTRNPALRVHAADARRYIRTTTNQYDVIVADLFHPALDGAGSLYTREHFEAIRNRLAQGGLFCQWLPLHQLDEQMVRIIIRTFMDVFPQANGWLLRFNADAPVLGLVGFSAAPHYSTDWIEQRLGSRDLQQQLKSQSLADSIRFFGCLLAGANELRAFAADAPVNTDEYPRVIFGAPRFSYRKDATSYGRLLLFLNGTYPDPREVLGLVPGPDTEHFAQRLTNYLQARDIYLRGLIAQADGQPAKALDLFVESARGSPDFTPGYAQAISVATLLAKTRPAEARVLLERLSAAQPSVPLARQLLERLSRQ